jgi:hypothetical protein
MTSATRALSALLVAWLAGSACSKGEEGSGAAARKPAYVPVGAGAAALREAFNQAAGKPRVVMLIAPT